MQDAMIRTIEQHALAAGGDTGRPRLAANVLAALRRVPRERFVPGAERRRAYGDWPLPIGHGQTISQPFIVALMVDLVEPHPGARILEIGSGCGYLAAVLAELGVEARGIEIVAPLADASARLLRELGYTRAHIRCGDGWQGWPEQAPFDGIIVSAAGREVPSALREQLRIGARMVLPLEDAGGSQHIELIERTGADAWRQRRLLGVRFVPITHGAGGDRA